MKKTCLNLIVAAAVCGALTPTLRAGVAEVSSKKTVIPEEPEESWITGDIGVEFVTQYVSRGLVLQNQGFIAQPFLDLYLKLYEGEQFITNVTAGIGLWGSIHSKPASSGGFKGFYEFDYLPGVSVTFFKVLTITTSYYEFLSPNNSFKTARSININTALDDSPWLGAFALYPHFTVLFEIDGSAGLVLDRLGQYYEIGIAPKLPILKEGPVSLGFVFPITLGLGSGEFYGNDTYGYFAATARLDIGLNFIPARYGTWSLNAFVTYYNIGDEAAAINNDRHNIAVGGGGITLAF